MSSYSRQQLEDWLKTIDVEGKVLDVGGSQNPIKGRTMSWNATDYKILDLEEPHECKQKPDYIGDIQKGTLWKPGSEVFKLESSDSEIPDNYFDQVFCIEVSEYWYNPLRALENINRTMKVGGKLYISFHFIYPMHNPVEFDYLRYTPWGACKLIEKVGFKLNKHHARILSDTGRRCYSDMIAVEGMRETRGLDMHDKYWQGSLIEAIKKY